MAREIVNRIQNMRKAADFELTDRILVGLSAHDELKSAIETHKDWIKSETLAVELTLVGTDAATAFDSIDIDGQEVSIAIERVA